MKIKFIQRHVIAGQTREEDLVYQKDQVVEFKGWVEETYGHAYIERGYAVAFDEEAERAAEASAALQAKLDARSAVDIPDGFADLPYAEMRALAVKLTDGSIGSKADALAAIQAEIERRNGVQR